MPAGRRSSKGLAAISSHGYGHAAQTASVVNALRERIPDLRLTLRTTVPHALLAARFEGAFTHVSVASDFGMRMGGEAAGKVQGTGGQGDVVDIAGLARDVQGGAVVRKGFAHGHGVTFSTLVGVPARSWA